MRYNKYFLLLPILLLLTGFKSSNPDDKKNQDIIAKIGSNYSVTFEELSKYVFDWLYHKKFRDKKEAYNNALYDMITNQLKRIDYFERGLDKNSELMQSIQRTINEELMVEYFDTQVLGKYTSEEFARKSYSNMSKEIIYREIVLKKPEKATPAQLDSLVKIAEKIKADIEQNNNFGKIVKKYSRYAVAKNSDGSMPPIKWEQSVSDPISQVIFELNAGDIRLLETYDSYHIVKVTGSNKIDIEPFDKIKNDIIAKLKKGYYEASVQEFYEEKKTLIDSSSLKWEQKGLEQIVTWSNIPKFYNELYKDTLRNAISNNKNFLILTYSNNRVDLKEYLRLLNEVLIIQTSGKIDESTIKGFILDALQTDILAKKAKQLGLEKKIINAYTKDTVLKDRLVRLYNQAVIESQVPRTSDEIMQKFYNEQKDSLYYQLDKVNVYAMVFADKEKADEAMQKIKSGISFEKVTGRWLVKAYVIDRKRNYLSYMNKEKPLLAEPAFKLGLNEISGPVEYVDPENGKQYAIVKCVEKREQKQLTYDDVKNTIAKDYVEYSTRKLSDETAKQLRKKYNVTIYEDVLAKKLSVEKN
jgi:hypothetical protein